MIGIKNIYSIDKPLLMQDNLNLKTNNFRDEHPSVNIKAALAHHPIIQKEVDELKAKVPVNDQLVLLSFTLNFFFVSKCTGGLTHT